MAQDEPERTPTDDSAHQAPTEGTATPAAPAAAPARRTGVPVWLWLVIAVAAVLGVLAGFGVVLRGQSLSSNPIGGTVARPTFVIGGAVVSPVPSVSPAPVTVPTSISVPAPLVTATVSEYVVQPGDTLRSIAETVYGDADQWPRIYAANRSLIGPDPDALQAGMRLQIP